MGQPVMSGNTVTATKFERPGSKPKQLDGRSGRWDGNTFTYDKPYELSAKGKRIRAKMGKGTVGAPTPTRKTLGSASSSTGAQTLG